MKWFPVIIVLLTFTAFGQPPIPVVKKDSCYKAAEARKKQRFPEWECGKVAGIVDCNEKLELDEGSNTVITASGKMPFTGTCETCHQNGLLERRVTFVNGKQNGIDTTKYASGCPMVIRSHVQGVENGRWTYFYDSLGTVAWEENYSMGQKHGPQVYYSKKQKASSGDTTKFEMYTNGVLNGPKITYDSKGKRMKQVSYVNGLLEGPFLVYNKEGKIIEELMYKQGKRNGVFKYYYDDGTLLRTENWTMDVRNGEFKTLYYEGHIQTLENYKKGIKEGWFEEYFPDQKPKRRALYKKDVLIEEHVFDENGREIKTFGGEVNSGAEDDEVPTGGKKKKEKKPKKTRTKTEPEKETEE
jgi:antitoxin component YwqK of YwqJK toxin-antitoxin module